jgi:acetyl esterase
VPLHPDARKFLDIVKDAPPLDTQTAEQNRADLNNALPLTGEKAEWASVQDLEIAGVRTRVYIRSKSDQPMPAVLYFHGGGWVIGDLEIADTTARALAFHSEALVISVDYRRAPEAPFPAAQEDALAVTKAVLNGDSGLDIDVERVAVAGDSAGGNLAAVTAQQLRGHSPALVHQALIYPATDLKDYDTPSRREFGPGGYFLTSRDLDYFYGTYAGGHDRGDVRLSPARNPDLTNLPSATVITAEYDPLRDEGEAYAHAMAEAGVSVTAVRFIGLVHPFIYLGGVIEGAHTARRLIGAQLRQAFAARPPHRE